MVHACTGLIVDIIGFDIAASVVAAPSVRSPPWVCSGLRALLVAPRDVSQYTYSAARCSYRGRSRIVIRYACTACGNGDYARSLLPSHTRGGPRADAGCAPCGRWPAALLMALASALGQTQKRAGARQTMTNMPFVTLSGKWRSALRGERRRPIGLALDARPGPALLRA